jgi:hypothetical protein
MRISAISLFSIGFFLVRGVCQAEEVGVLVSKFEKGVPVTQLETNDFHHSAMLRYWGKQTPDVKPDKPQQWRKSYDLFGAALVRSAKDAGLQYRSLAELLKKLPQTEENKGLAGETSRRPDFLRRL